MAKTVSLTSKATAQRLCTEMHKAAHAVASAFGDRYSFKFIDSVTEHRFINYMHDAIPLARVKTGSKVRTPRKLTDVGAMSLERLFRQSFAGAAGYGWATRDIQVVSRDAMAPLFNFVTRNAEHLIVSAEVYRDPITQAPRFDIYLETKHIEGADKTTLWFTVNSVDIVKLKAANPFQR